MSIVLGLLVAITYGGADFYGGLGARKLPTFTVLLWSQMVGLVAMVAYAAFLAPALPPNRELLFGLAGGVAGFSGIALQYRALALGPMRLVAPISAIFSAALPVGISVGRGESVTGAAAVGIGLCMAAMVALGLAENSEPTRVSARRAEGPLLAAAAGVGFGLFFVFFGELESDSGLWPVVVDRMVSVALAATVACVVRARRAPGDRPTSWRPGLPGTAVILACGVLDVSAHSLYVAAGHEGLTSEMAVLASLYPAATVVLAVLVLHEMVRRPHLVGFALAAFGVGLIAVG